MINITIFITSSTTIAIKSTTRTIILLFVTTIMIDMFCYSQCCPLPSPHFLETLFQIVDAPIFGIIFQLRRSSCQNPFEAQTQCVGPNLMNFLAVYFWVLHLDATPYFCNWLTVSWDYEKVYPSYFIYYYVVVA